MKRFLGFLLIGILSAGVIALGMLLWQTNNNLNDTKTELLKSEGTVASLQSQNIEKQRNISDLQTQLNKSQQTVQAVQAQLASSMNTIQNLQTQLDEANAKINNMQAEIDDLKSPPLTPSEPVILTGGLWSGGTLSFPIELKRFEKVQGEVIGGFPDLLFYIQDPAGGKVQDFGRIRQTNFMFTAQMDGRYTVVITNPSGLYNTSYTLRYTIYRR